MRRLARGRERPRPLAAAPIPPSVRVSVVIPARDEAGRIGPCLAGLRGQGAAEVLVVDDCSTDATAAVARELGARVIEGREPPPRWIGKPWALQQGALAASGDVLVCLDADTRPRPGLLGALAVALDGADLVTAGTRFVCRGPGERWLHASLLASLVYRYGPAERPASPSRLLANGQCFAVRRRPFMAAGGFAAAPEHMTDDVALARALARSGRRVAFRQGGGLVEVRMHESAREVWREWGRSIALADVTPPAWRAADAAVVWLTMALPPAAVARRRATAVDVALLALRLAATAAIAPAYRPRGLAFWLSPAADPLTALRLTLSSLRPPRTWRGRTYGAGGRARR